MPVLDIWINCPSPRVAETIAQRLLSSRLIACSNVFPAIESAYHWKGEIETETEYPLLVKTRSTLFEAVCGVVAAMHPYETPSMIGIPIEFVNAAYEAWVYAETAEPGP